MKKIVLAVVLFIIGFFLPLAGILGFIAYRFGTGSENFSIFSQLPWMASIFGLIGLVPALALVIIAIVTKDRAAWWAFYASIAFNYLPASFFYFNDFNREAMAIAFIPIFVAGTSFFGSILGFIAHYLWKKIRQTSA